MKLFFAKFARVFAMKSARDSYLGGAADLAELEFRMKQWNQMELDRARNFHPHRF